MSAPAFVWALERGHDLRLPTSARMVLIYLADKANGHREAWPCQETIADWTGLKERAVRLATRTLEQAGLIRCAYRGKLRLYYILRPANGEGKIPAPNADVMAANNAGGAHSTANGAGNKTASNAGVGRRHRQNPTRSPAFNAKTPASNAPNPSTNQEKNLERAKEGKDLSTGKKEDGTPPSVPPAPAPPPQPTATGSSNAYRPPGATEPPTDDFNSYLDAPAPTKALPCEVDHDVVRSDVPDPDGPPPPGAFKALIDSIASGFQNNYPARLTDLTRDEQAAVCQEKLRPKTYHLSPEQLRIARPKLKVPA